MPDTAYYVHDLNPFLWQWSETWGIRYYGVAYILGFIAVWAGLEWFRRKGWSRLGPGEPADLLTWLIIGTLVGGRIGYCLFYDWHETLRDPVSIIAFWRSGGISGMASHGGMAGIILALALYAWKHGHPFRAVSDDVAVLAPIGIFFGRIANFINGELWGRPSEVPWAVIFPQAPLVGGQEVPRHPSQLYEALGEGLVLCLFVFAVYRLAPRRGWAGAAFLGGYAVARIVCEQFREPDSHIGFLFAGMTMGQLLSLVLFPAAAALILWPRRT